MPADITLICSPFVLRHCSPDQVPGVQNSGRAAVGSLCPFTGCRDKSFCISPLLEDAGPSVVLSALHGAYLIILINNQSVINNTGNIIM